VQCSGNTPQTCDANGQWASGSACSEPTPFCGTGTCRASRCAAPNLATGAYVIAPIIDFGTSYSIAFWMKIGTLNPGGASIFSDGYTGTYCGSVWMQVDQGRTLFTNASDGANDPTRCETKAVPEPGLLSTSTLGTVWTHVAVVFAGTQLRLYLNGVLDASRSTAAIDPYTSTHALWFGREDGFARAFNGSLRDIGVWSRTLNAADVASLANRASAPGGLSTGLVAWWPLDEGSGTTLRDASGNARNARLSSDSWVTDCP
jgi:hypothetical protein